MSRRLVPGYTDYGPPVSVTPEGRGTGRPGLAQVMRGRGSRGAARLGNVTVEFGLIAPVLLLLLFGTVEFGLVFKDLLTLNQACREGARAASIGAPVGDIYSVVQSHAPGLAQNSLTITLSWRRHQGSTWTQWYTMGDTGTTTLENDAPNGAQIRVQVEYPHALITGRLLSGLTGGDGATYTLRSTMYIRRE